jgi:hypothetical protein
MKHLVKIDITASNRNHEALLKVRTKPGGVAKPMQDGRQINNVLLNRGNKNGRIIRIEGSAKDGSPTPKPVKKPVPRGDLQHLGKRINRNEEKERG